MPGYKFLEHMTDAEIEAYGTTLSEAFENAGRALEDTMVDITSVRKIVHEKVELEAEDKEALLYSWLESLINKEDIDGMLYSDFACTVERMGEKIRLDAKISGEKFDPKRHEQKSAVKAPTYHDMKIIEEPDRVTMRFLLDL